MQKNKKDTKKKVTTYRKRKGQRTVKLRVKKTKNELMPTRENKK